MKDISSELNQEASRLMAIPGNVRGEIFKGNINYIKFKAGQEGLFLLEERIKDLGLPLRLQRFKSLKWYPEFFSVIIMLAIKEVLNWQDKDIFEMGNQVPKSSFVVQVLMKHFGSLKKSFNEYPRYWRAHFDFGDLEIVTLNEQDKYFIFRIRDYAFNSVACAYYAGYFLRISQFNIKSEKIRILENRCSHKEEIDFHEYQVEWE